MPSVSTLSRSSATKKKTAAVAPKGKAQPKVSAPAKKTAASSVSKPKGKAPAPTLTPVAIVHEPAFALDPNDPIGLVGHDLGPLPNDEVFDETDGAQHLQLRELADVQRRARLLNQPEFHPDFDGVHCVDCDDDMPKVRLDMKRVRCVRCQQDLENLTKKQAAGGR